MKNTYAVLSKINVNEMTREKNNLTYLSWAHAWGAVLNAFDDANYTIYENAQGFNYHTDGKTAWVKTGVVIEEKEYIEYLPVMDFKNKSITADKITSVDVNKAIQRSLTKACARHGLGLYIYAGEDLPEEDKVPPVDVIGELVKLGMDKAKVGAIAKSAGLNDVKLDASWKTKKDKLIEYFTEQVAK